MAKRKIKIQVCAFSINGGQFINNLVDKKDFIKNIDLLIDAVESGQSKKIEIIIE